MGGTGYIIKTTTGDRGPFSTDQIRELTSQGKLQPSVHLRDAARGHSVTVAEVLDGRAKIKAMAVSTADIMIEDIPGAPPLASPPAAAEAPRRADRQSSSRRPQQQDRAHSSRRSVNEGSMERTGRQTRGKPKPIMLYVAIAIALLGVVVLVLVVGKTRPVAAGPSAPSAR